MTLAKPLLARLMTGVMAAMIGVVMLAGPGPAFAAGAGLALIYRGPGACDGCPEAAGLVASRVGLKVRYVSGPEITPELLASAAVYIQGGGEDVMDIRRSLTDTQVAWLKDYIAGGGRYWGICAGGYFAGKSIDDEGDGVGLQLFKGDAAGYSPYEASMEQVLWNGVPRWMYLQEAPHFVLAPGSRAEVTATYKGGEVAALLAPYGRGWISLSGPHPEATQEWLELDDLEDPGLAPAHLADDMLKDLLRRGP
jgi:glutamine amidotransferase-like uncharacterized protein